MIYPLVPRPILHSRNSPNQHNHVCFREKWSLKTLLSTNNFYNGLNRFQKRFWCNVFFNLTYRRQFAYWIMCPWSLSFKIVRVEVRIFYSANSHDMMMMLWRPLCCFLPRSICFFYLTSSECSSLNWRWPIRQSQAYTWRQWEPPLSWCLFWEFSLSCSLTSHRDGSLLKYTTTSCTY